MFKKLTKYVIIALIVLIFVEILSIFKVSDTRTNQYFKSFHSNKENTVDAVYIGASNVYSCYQAPISYGEYGLATSVIGSPNMPAASFKYIIQDCTKKQASALYLVSLLTFIKTSINATDIHCLLDYMPFSKTKVQLTEDLCARAGITGMDKLEFYFPFIRFLSAWKKLTPEYMERNYNGLKGGATYLSFLADSKDVSQEYRKTNECIKPSDECLQLLFDFISYTSENGIKVLFIIEPVPLKDATNVAKINFLCNIVRENGFDVLDLQGKAEEIGINTATDYYNAPHTNVHGSLKYTRYLSEYLLNAGYGFIDKRGNSDYADWDIAYEKYLEKLKPNTLDFEINNSPRDYNLQIPQNQKCEVYGSSCTLTWDNVEGASAYAVYRRYKNASWEKIAETDANMYYDSGLKRYAKYTYTVIPMSNNNNILAYGNFSVNGTTITVPLDAAELLSLDESEQGITINWNPVDGAQGYYIERKIVGQDWIRIATVDVNTLTYTDNSYQSELPYIYTVVSYAKKDGKEKSGSADRNGLLRNKPIAAPEIQAERHDAENIISWTEVKGASDYFVYRLLNNGEWERIAQIQSGTELTYKESSYQSSGIYRVSAALIHGSEVYEYPSKTVAVGRKAHFC